VRDIRRDVTTTSWARGERVVDTHRPRLSSGRARSAKLRRRGRTFASDEQKAHHDFRRPNSAFVAAAAGIMQRRNPEAAAEPRMPGDVGAVRLIIPKRDRGRGIFATMILA